MIKSDFIKLIEQPHLVHADHLEELDSLLIKYPYLQSARALLLKGLKNKGSFKYNHELKTTAAHTTDRHMLFEFITSDVFKKQDNGQEIHNKIRAAQTKENKEVIETNENDTDASFENDSTATNTTEAELKSALQIGKPLEFNINETHSFSEWLKLSSFKPIEREQPTTEASQNTDLDTVKKEDSVGKKRALIDKFLSSNPKIVPKKTLKNNENLAKNNPKGDQELMTETLARIYLEQKNYKKAIQSYKILSLKYPEKNSFFADQIKKIKALEEYNK